MRFSTLRHPPCKLSDLQRVQKAIVEDPALMSSCDLSYPDESPQRL